MIPTRPEPDELVDGIYTVKQLKRIHRDARKGRNGHQRSERRRQRLRHWRCFRTWPFRHEWETHELLEWDGKKWNRTCVGCDKHKMRH